ncbi:MAG: MazG family protein [Acidimicrobiales bacterium]|jgi:tetrapyrrole methylase family protein / MazG family protein
MARSQASAPPVIVVVGLGPAGTDMMTAGALEVVAEASSSGVPVFFRTGRHPSAAQLLAAATGAPPPQTFDDRYSSETTFEAVYDSIASSLLAAAASEPRLVYAVPGSPLVAERTVELLRVRSEAAGVVLELVPGLSFCDLAWARLGVDPLSAGVRLVDGTTFGRSAAFDHGPLLVAQCWSNAVLSDVKLALEEPPPEQRAVVLHHLGLSDEQIVDVAWEDLDRVVEADHLTSVFVEHLAAPVGAELLRLVETVATLRLQCPWDREQTHESLVRHLLEETYEAIEALEGLGSEPSQAPPERVAHAEEELGDVLCQVVFHATLAREEGLFELADVARTISEKLVRRHPHVFGDVVAATAADVVTNWERIKRDEKGRRGLLDGIPASLPSLARAAAIERKLASVGLGWAPARGVGEAVSQLGSGFRSYVSETDYQNAGDPAAPPRAAADSADGADPDPADLILALALAIAASGHDPEGAVRRALDRLVAAVVALEASAAERGVEVSELPAAGLPGWLGDRPQPPAVPPPAP